MDNKSAEQRRENMSHIRSTNTKPEEIVRNHLFSKGFRYRKNDKRYPGKPDIVLPKYRTLVYVNGCFWHGHNCRNTTPKQNCEYWQQKISRNKIHDAEITTHFLNRGWKVLRIWECELKKSNRDRLIESLQNAGIYSPNIPVERKEVL